MKKIKGLLILLSLSLLTSCGGIFTSNSGINNSASSINGSNSSNITPKGETTLNILELNDIHGYAYESSSDANYNLANASTYINGVRKQKEYDNVLLIANGDTFQGTAFSNLSYGASVIKAMNKMNFDMMGIGNHEFDWTLDKVLTYWDGDENNVEANFPLINGNVRDSKNENKLVGEDNENDNILPYKIVEKSGVKVGLLSYIGDQTNSICQNKFGSYYIDCHGDRDVKFTSFVKSQALKLKELGADVIVINFHEGNADSINYLNYNKDFASMKDNNGKYLIDAVINGHTHTVQNGLITRSNGVSLPVVQAGANCNYIGQIDLTIDLNSKKVTNATSKTIRTSLTKTKDSEVKKVLDSEYETIKPRISEVLAVSNSYVSKAKIGEWSSNLMKKYCGADLAFINTGGIRSNGNIELDTKITMEELYQINPFDNSLVYVKVKGSDIWNFVEESESYYYFNSHFYVGNFSTTQTYNLVTIDFVYYSVYFQNTFSEVEEIEIDTICARDLMVKELRMSKDDVSIGSDRIHLTQEKNVF